LEITGEVGAGRHLCRALLRQLDRAPRAPSYSILPSGDAAPSGHTGRLRIVVERKNKISMLKQLNSFLIEEVSKGNNVILIIDEAQNLKASILEEIRMLSNLETEKEKLFQIILVGQPELKAKLASPD